MTSPPPPPSRAAVWLSWPLLLLGAGGFSAIWVLLSLSNDSQNGWMAVLGALDAAWLLRLVHWPAGPRRITVAVLTTLVIVALANWGIIASHLGGMLGLQPWESAVRLGPRMAWTLFHLANGTAELVWYALAVAVAAFVAK